jgi:hypothetical protein
VSCEDSKYLVATSPKILSVKLLIGRMFARLEIASLGLDFGIFD